VTRQKYINSSNKRVAQPLNGHQLLSYIADFIGAVFYSKGAQIPPAMADHTFDSNKTFWKYISDQYRIFSGRVKLENMAVTDWFPRTPGRYYTQNAVETRKRVQPSSMTPNGFAIYEPDMKASLIDQGGLGTLRFKRTSFDGNDYYLGTASSTRYCHTGVPIAIPQYFIDRDEHFFAHKYDLFGTLADVPPKIDALAHYTHNTPHIFLVVDDLKRKEPSKPPLIITPAILFVSEQLAASLDPNYKSDDKLATFASYITCASQSKVILDEAREWIWSYTNKYEGRIITDYDEQMPAFPDAPLSIAKVISGQVTHQVINQYMGTYYGDIVIRSLDSLNMSGGTVVNNNKIDFGRGNTFNGKVNATIAGSIQSSFNETVQSSVMTEELKGLLGQLAQAVAGLAEQLPSEEGEAAASDYKELTKEANKAKPDRRRWEFSIEGLKKAAQNVGAIGQPVIDLAVKIAAILAVKA